MAEGDRAPEAAVTRVLREVLRRRVAGAFAVDPVFAHDVARALARFALSGGSRRRAALVWWTWRACGGRSADQAPDAGGHEAAGVRAAVRAGAPTGPLAVLQVAAALELIQCCALIHDDVMDGSSTRRGRPAVHVELATLHGGDGPPEPGGAAPFGWSAAVLAGDLALAWADDVLAEAALPEPVRGAVQSVWRAMRTEMVAGQYLDLLGPRSGRLAPGSGGPGGSCGPSGPGGSCGPSGSGGLGDPGGLGGSGGSGAHPGGAGSALRTAVLKSGLYSVERPLSLGAALAGADLGVRRALRSAGCDAGLAFQLRDDLLGVFGDPAATGKPSGDDIRTGKATYLIAVARQRAGRTGDRAALRVLDDALGDASLSPAGLDRVREVIVATGARDAVERRIARLTAACATVLAGAPLDPKARGSLLELLQSGAGRTTSQEDTP